MLAKLLRFIHILSLGRLCREEQADPPKDDFTIVDHKGWYVTYRGVSNFDPDDGWDPGLGYGRQAEKREAAAKLRDWKRANINYNEVMGPY